MKRLALTLALLPGLALADECKHADNRELALDLQGVSLVRFEVNSHDLSLEGAGDDTVAPLRIRACASDADYLPQLVVESERSGDTLHVRIERQGKSNGIFFNSNYARMDVHARLPAGLAYEVDVGSGDAQVSGVSRLAAEVGSGDIQARRIAGAVVAEVGSGDLDFDDVGSLQVRSVGSGDLEARHVRGDVRVGSIGSGDMNVDGVGGNVHVERIGSGDLDVQDVQGDLVVDRLGSGEVDYSDIRGKVRVPKDD